MESKKVYCAVDTMFNNSQAIVVEYHDCLKSPWFLLLRTIIEDIPPIMREIFDFSELENSTEEEIYSWYINRLNRNFLKDLPLVNPDKPIPEGIYDIFLDNLMCCDYSLYKLSPPLLFFNVLKMLASAKGLVKKIIVFNETYDQNIEKDIRNNFNEFIEFRYGTLEEILTDIPNDSTFVFSDIDKIEELNRIGKLKFSSILISHGYRYNFTKNDIRKFKVDISSLIDQVLFKFDFFNNLYISEEDPITEALENGSFEELFPCE